MALVACSAFFAVSCEQRLDADADPVVRFIKPCDPAIGDRLLTEVAMGGTVAIIGEGLGDVCRIAFNDQVCKLNPAFVTSTSIIVNVPSTMPKEVTNKMYLETKSGKKAEFDIAVLIPAPVIESVSCLWAPAGSDIVLTGKYFFADDNGLVAVEFPGAKAAVVKSVTETEVVCTVPEGAVLEGKISVTSKYGTSRSVDTWRTKEGLFEDFVDLGETPWTGAFATEGGCDGQYLYLSGAVGEWAWPANEIQYLWMSPNGQILTEGEIADYALQFEYCCAKWDCTPLIMWFDNDGAHNVDGEQAQFHWKLYDDGFSPGVWATKTVPLTDFNTNKEENETRAIKGLHELVNFNMLPFGAGFAGGELDIKIDNLRLISIK